MSWSTLYRYWLSKHVDGRPPSRKDIDPLIEIPSLIANLMLIAIEPAGYRNQLIGTAIVNRVGHDDTGRLIDRALFGPTSLPAWLALMDKVTRTQRPQRVKVRIAPSEKERMLTLMLPLVGRDGQTEGIFSGCFFEGSAEPLGSDPVELFEVVIPYDEPGPSRLRP